jgi:hypothetical protein
VDVYVKTEEYIPWDAKESEKSQMESVLGLVAKNAEHSICVKND